MPSTYTNDLRLELIGVGEGAGSAPNDWGSKTNVNLTSIASAFGPGVENLSSDANATLTLADGVSDDLRAIYLKITSVSLTATRVVTIAPNDIAKLWIIENATTGSQSITIKQGNGATVTIANSAVKAIYTDGAGAGAAVVDALVDLDLTGVTTIAQATIANGTFTGTQVDITGQGDLRLQDASGGQYAAIQAPSTIGSSYTLTLPADDGSASEFLSTDGSGVLSWAAAGGAYSAFLLKDADFTASASDQLICKHNSTPFTITLPASPTAMDTVVICNAGAATVTVGRNSSNINSTASDHTLVQGTSTQLVYVDGTIGWFEI
tara:strand:- start:3985 stop:4950 length:966 start_codon:yes stop_codon:yes gene_type:complete